MTLVDTHAHLTFEQFDADRERVLERAWAADLTALLVIGAGGGVDENQKALKLAGTDPRLFVAVGIHPNDTALMTEGWYQRVCEYAKEKKVVAIGEIGLDFYRDTSARDLQEKWFRRQIELAHEVELPIIIHCRDAYAEVWQLLEEVGVPPRGGVFHAYAGDSAYANRAMESGFFVSVTGVITFKNASPLREVITDIPLEKLMLETDCPYLAPEPYRGKRNEPAYVKEVAKKIAEVKSVVEGDIAEVTTRNAVQLFGLGRR